MRGLFLARRKEIERRLDLLPPDDRQALRQACMSSKIVFDFKPKCCLLVSARLKASQGHSRCCREAGWQGRRGELVDPTSLILLCPDVLRRGSLGHINLLAAERLIDLRWRRRRQWPLHHHNGQEMARIRRRGDPAVGGLPKVLIGTRTLLVPRRSHEAVAVARTSWRLNSGSKCQRAPSGSAVLSA